MFTELVHLFVRHHACLETWEQLPPNYSLQIRDSIPISLTLQ